VGGDRVEIYPDAAGEWRWRRLATNGEVVSDSGEGYVRKTDAIGAAHAVNVDVEDFQILEKGMD
jgi:uncharacterized protein YegP (UPF0339 family)